MNAEFPPVPDGEPYLRDLVDNTSAVIYVKDLAGRYLHINRKWAELFSVEQEEMVGKTDYHVFPAETAAAFQENDRRVAEEGRVIQFQEVVPQDDGIHIYLSVKFPLRDEQGRIYAMSGISTDITDRVAAEQEREQVSHRLQLILDSVNEGVYGLDCEGRTTFINAAGAKMIGWPAQELVGKKQHDVLHFKHADGSPYPVEECPIHSVLRDGQPRQVDHEVFWRSDGTGFPVEYTASPIQDGDETIGVVVTFRDLTDSMKHRHALAELEAAERVQQRLYPSGSPVIPGFEIAGAAYSAELACGDYYDFITLADGSVVIAVGDVSGHGLGPALHMVETRVCLRALLQSGLDLTESLNQLNRHLCDDMAEGSFVSLFLVQIEPGKRKLRYAGAGHDARLMRSNGTVEKLVNTGMVLGMLRNDASPTTETVSLSQGDILFIPTDGLRETSDSDQEMLGWQPTLDLLYESRAESSREIIRRLYQQSVEFADHFEQKDDVTMVVVKVL
ncbi:SpoIIE family protein phosphatase [Thalassoroseus pseudoceratinae]|uniref:SpoIIE family protein phosphatase n=1 Tax=Thalassoroseus pseudoceratinae TaxID=2713176 RepID=UPI00141EFF40|nr:SpoIIE family protein phosphatase [Thalassoroseus pseudoceratinae]